MTPSDHDHVPSQKTALIDQWIGDGSSTAHIEVDGQGFAINRGLVMWMQIEAMGRGVTVEELVRQRFGADDRRN